MNNIQEYLLYDRAKRVVQSKNLNIFFDEMLELFSVVNKSTPRKRINGFKKILLYLKHTNFYLSSILIVLTFEFFLWKEIFLLLFSSNLNRSILLGTIFVFVLFTFLSFWLTTSILNFIKYIIFYQSLKTEKAQKNIQKIKVKFLKDLKIKGININEMNDAVKYKYIEIFIKSLIEKKQSETKKIYSFLPVIAVFYWFLIIWIIGLPIPFIGEDFYKAIPLTITVVGFIVLMLKSFIEFLEAEDQIVYEECLLFLEQVQLLAEKSEVDNSFVSSQKK